jgi:hypothetical protein
MQGNLNIRPVNGTGHTTGKSPRDYLRERDAVKAQEARRRQRQAWAAFRSARVATWAP